MPTLHELARYNRWANARLLARCREDDAAEHVFAAAGGTLGTIEETLKHVALVEESYLAFMSGHDPLQGRDRESVVAEYLGHDLEWFADHVGEIDRDFERYVAEADEAALAGPLRIPWFDFPVTRAEGVLQVLTHSHTHRSQVLSTLGDRGVAVPDMDFIHLLQEERARG